MSDDTRKLLKVFGVAVTDFEAEAERLKARAATLAPSGGQREAAQLLKDLTELCQEVRTRWWDVTHRIHEVEGALLRECSQAAAKLTGA